MVGENVPPWYAFNSLGACGERGVGGERRFNELTCKCARYGSRGKYRATCLRSPVEGTHPRVVGVAEPAKTDHLGIPTQVAAM